MASKSKSMENLQRNKYTFVCLWKTYDGPGLCDEEQFGEGSVKRQQHSDTGGILAQAVFHSHKEVPQRSQQRQLTGSTVQTSS